MTAFFPALETGDRYRRGNAQIFLIGRRAGNVIRSVTSATLQLLSFSNKSCARALGRKARSSRERRVIRLMRRAFARRFRLDSTRCSSYDFLRAILSFRSNGGKGDGGGKV